METVKEVLNIGIPIFQPIRITYDELESIADDIDVLKACKNRANLDFINGKIFTRGLSFFRKDFDYIDGLYIVADPYDSVSKVYIDPSYYFIKIQELLNIDTIIYDYNDPDVKEQICKKLDILKNINSENILKEEFPELYDYMMSGRELNKKILTEKDDNKIEALEKLYYRYCHFRHLTDRFSQEQEKMLRAEVDNFDKILNIGSNKPSYNYISGVNLKKLQILVAYKYVKLGEMYNDKSVWQQVMNYLLPTVTDTSLDNININIDGKVINTEYLSNYYIDINKRFKLTPFFINRGEFVGKNVYESSDYVNKMLDQNVIDGTTFESEKQNKSSIQSNTDTQKEEKIVMPTIPKIIIPKPVDPSVLKVTNSREPKRYKYVKTNEVLKKLFQKKSEYLGSSGYDYHYWTPLELDGYNYFIYNNTVIFREKFFRNYKTLKYEYDNAMFFLNMDDFFEIYREDRTKLTSFSNDIARKIVHGNSYESIAQGYVELPTTQETIEKTTDFVKKLDEKAKELKKTRYIY